MIFKKIRTQLDGALKMAFAESQLFIIEAREVTKLSIKVAERTTEKIFRTKLNYPIHHRLNAILIPE